MRDQIFHAKWTPEVFDEWQQIIEPGPHVALAHAYLDLLVEEFQHGHRADLATVDATQR